MPNTPTHFLIRTNFEEILEKEYTIKDCFINKLFCDNYYMNVNSKSCFRYLLNFITFICSYNNNTMLNVNDSSKEENYLLDNNIYKDSPWFKRSSIIQSVINNKL